MSKIAFLFPGQGSQYVGMGKTLCKRYTAAEEIFRKAERILGSELIKLCFNGPYDKLSRTENAQSAILTASVAAYTVIRRELGINPEYMTGHSFGELSALTCAESVGFTDAFKIAKFKGELVQKMSDSLNSAMTAVSGIDAKDVEVICAEASSASSCVVLGVINAPRFTVISGDISAVKRAEAGLLDRGAELHRVAVSAPFHSPYLKEATRIAEKELSRYKFGPPRRTVVSSLTARPLKSARDIIYSLSAQLAHPIRWADTIDFLKKEGVSRAVEVGPKTVLTSITRNITDDIKVVPFGSPKDISALKNEFRHNNGGG